jgi:hypothetical protein
VAAGRQELSAAIVAHQVISRPDTRSVKAVAALAMVLMKSPELSTWPTSSGHV